MEICSKHNVNFENYAGFWKCPQCNWEQAMVGYGANETLSLCKHHIPVKLGICVDCAKEHENNLLKSQLKSLEERIVNIESSQLCQQLDPQVWFYVNERLDKLESLNKIELNKKPHKCPVCYGRGFREDQFLKQHKCHNCECTGVIWG